ncbi:MAG: ABC transporter ATP-binding protein, partial [Saprospiraceae bacterium]
AALVLAVWIVAAVAVFGLSRLLRLTTMDRRGQRSKGLGFVSERLQAFYTIKSFNRERPETERYAQESRRLFRFGIRFYRFSALIQALFPVFFYGTLGWVMWLAMVAPDDGHGHGDFFAFVLLLLHLHTVLQRMLEVNLVWQSGSVSLTKLAILLDKPVEEGNSESMPQKTAGRIEFDRVTFGYSPGKKVFSELDFTIHPRSITLLQGRHGTGKSTVLKLLQKMYAPESGSIRLDGQDLDAVSPFDLRKKVTIVSPAAPLLGANVFQAISYNENPDKRERALELLDKLQFSLGSSGEETLDYPLEEQARNLSSGQIALLQIVRALLTEKPILLLDEPFVQLDSGQAGRVARLLNKLKTKHTILLISKRPPSRLEVDHFLSLDTHYEKEASATDSDDRLLGD